MLVLCTINLHVMDETCVAFYLKHLALIIPLGIRAHCLNKPMIQVFFFFMAEETFSSATNPMNMIVSNPLSSSSNNILVSINAIALEWVYPKCFTYRL